MKSNARLLAFKRLYPAVNGARCRSLQHEQTTPARVCFISTDHQLCTRSFRAAQMHPCVRPKDKRRHRELGCLIPNDPPLPISGGNHTDRIDGRPNWLCLPVAPPGQIHNWATRRSTLGADRAHRPGRPPQIDPISARFQIF